MEIYNLTPIVTPILIAEGLSLKDAENYCERAYKDFSELKDLLPPNKKQVIEIGSSWGLHAVYLSRHYSPETEFILIDGEKTIRKPHTGFRENTQPYRDGRIGLRLMGEFKALATFVPVDKETTRLTFPGTDLIVSFCAWNHHFPTFTYLPMVQSSLIPGGHIITDIRTGTNGLDQMRVAGFRVEQIIRRKSKYTRYLFSKLQ